MPRFDVIDLAVGGNRRVPEFDFMSRGEFACPSDQNSLAVFAGCG